jgi:hypothetical protein
LRDLRLRVAGIDEVFADNDPPTYCDYWSPLMSLPAVLGTKFISIPPAPYLSAKPVLVEKWRRELELLDGFRVGIQWQGNLAHPKDKFRSFPLQIFQAIASLPCVRLVSLQKGPGSEQIRNVDFPVYDLGPRLDESAGAFMDTAAVMQSLDLVITTDSSIGHLAGALGRPTWIPLSTVPEWRWLRDRDDSPWYPTVRLFRQSRRNGWNEVFSRMCHLLQPIAARSSLEDRREAG